MISSRHAHGRCRNGQVTAWKGRCNVMSDSLNSTDRPESCRVLVVEDNPSVARMATMMLEMYGLDVQTLSRGRPVVDAARSFRPHFILLDIGLPDIDGFEVAKLLRQEPDLKKTVIIAVSAYSPDMYPAESRTAPFDHYLVKPVDFDALVSLFRTAAPQEAVADGAVE